MSRQRAGCLPVAPEATATSDAAEVVGSKRKQLAPPHAAEAAAPAGDASTVNENRCDASTAAAALSAVDVAQAQAAAPAPKAPRLAEDGTAAQAASASSASAAKTDAEEVEEAEEAKEAKEAKEAEAAQAADASTATDAASDGVAGADVVAGADGVAGGGMGGSGEENDAMIAHEPDGEPDHDAVAEDKDGIEEDNEVEMFQEDNEVEMFEEDAEPLALTTPSATPAPRRTDRPTPLPMVSAPSVAAAAAAGADPSTALGAWGTPPHFEPLAPVAVLLHPGGISRRGPVVSQQEGAAVQHLLAFPQLKKVGPGLPRAPQETLLVIHANGMMFGFTRSKQIPQPSPLLASPHPQSAHAFEAAPTPPALPPLPQLRPLCVYGNEAVPLLPGHAGHGPGEKVFRSTLIKLHNTDKIIVCVMGSLKLYEVPHEKITQKQGLDPASQTNIERQFEQRMPEVLKNISQVPAIHPRDNNLYATACTDGTIVVKNFHIEMQHQVIGQPCISGLHAVTAEELPVAQPPPPTHVFFTPHGSMLIVVKTPAPMFPAVRGNTPTQSSDSPPASGASADDSCAVGLARGGGGRSSDTVRPTPATPATPPTMLLCYEVPPYAIAPGAREPEEFQTKRSAFPESDDGQRQYEAALKAEKKEKKDRTHHDLTFWVDEVNRHNRGDRLLPQDPRNVQLIPLGHPIMAVPRPSKLPRLPVHGFPRCTIAREDKEYALLLWAEQAQMWLVAGGAMQVTATFRSPHLSCVAPLEWPTPPPASAAEMQLNGHWGSGGGLAESTKTTLYWLVGTSRGEVHVLHGDTLARVTILPAHTARLASPSASRALCRTTTHGVLLGSKVPPAVLPAAGGATRSSTASYAEYEAAALARGDKPVGISALTVIKPDPKPDEPRASARELAEAALVVGFEDGAARQYRLVDVLFAACEGATRA